MDPNHYDFTVSGNRIVNFGDVSLPLQEIKVLEVRQIRTFGDFIGDLFMSCLGVAIMLFVANVIIHGVFGESAFVKWCLIVLFFGCIPKIAIELLKKPTVALIAVTRDGKERNLVESKDSEKMLNTKNLIADAYAARKEDQIITQQQSEVNPKKFDTGS